MVQAVKLAAHEIPVVETPAEFALPRTVDWRTTPGVVSSVKDQVKIEYYVENMIGRPSKFSLKCDRLVCICNDQL